MFIAARNEVELFPDVRPALERLAALTGLADAPRIYPCRGDYFRLHAPGRFTQLVYPVRARGSHGLGVHLTLELDGGLRLGPDAEYVARRDDFGPAEHKHAAFLAAARAFVEDTRLREAA